jgi:hypothetical protein
MSIVIRKSDYFASLDEIIETSKEMRDNAICFSRDQSLSEIQRRLFNSIAACAATNEHMAMVLFNLIAHGHIKICDTNQ